MKPICLLMWLSLATTCPAQNRYSVIISEIMADPSPVVGLPAYEWIELKNTGTFAVNLQNCRIGDATGTSGPLPNYLLRPDSMVIICASSAAASMSAYGPTLTVTSFPSLDNDGDLIWLRGANGMTLHAVAYTNEWYRNEVKKDGGWSLEMIDTKNPCGGGENWKASEHPIGGSPGKKNATDSQLPDQTGPQLLRSYPTDSITVILLCNEPLDSANAVDASHYTLDGNITIRSIRCLPPLFSQVELRLNTPLQPGRIYGIRANGLTDCTGNPLGGTGLVRVGLPVDPDRGEWIINEILFNPRPNGHDFVECYNNSDKIFDAARLYIANRNSSGAVSSVKALCASPFLIFPGQHIVVTENASRLALHYLVSRPDQVLVVTAPPSFPDDEGTVVALNAQGQITDEVHYKDDWHFQLLADQEGISLERIDPGGASQDPANWHSAASTAGSATPTAPNSQYKQINAPIASLEVSPPVFSPDNDGRDDVATIQYRVNEPGYVANIVIWDALGRPVRQLVRNATLGLSGYWNWDGLDDRGRQLPAGTYIVWAEVFNLQGKKQKWKKALILARYLK